MEEKGVSLQSVLESVWHDGEKASKTLNRIFDEINAIMGVSIYFLKDDKGQYKFSNKSAEFWKNVLNHYTDPPYSYIRNRDYANIPLDVIRSYMEMVADTMSRAGKSIHEIERVLLKIENITRYDDRLFHQKMRSFTEKVFEQYMNEITNSTYLLWSDRLQILGYIERVLMPKCFDSLITQAKEIIQEVNDERLDEVTSALIGLDGNSCDAKIIEADGKADRLIRNDRSITEAENKLVAAKIDDPKGVMASHIRSLINVEKEKQAIRKEVDKEFGISSEQRRKYNIVKYRPAKTVLNDVIDGLKID